jgi:hypothetical protein
MLETKQPPGNPSTLTQVHTRLNPAEMLAFERLQRDLGHEGHGAQAETLRELVRDRCKQNGYLGRPKQ